MSEREQATCRGCGMRLVGDGYQYGGSARHPITGETCKVNFYGGYVCSRSCDFKSSLELEQGMPGHDGLQRYLGCCARQSLNKNWG